MAPTPCNYLLKTLEDKRENKNQTSSRTAVCQRTSEQLPQAMGSAVPLTSLALPQSIPSRWQGWWAPWDRECAEVLREEGPLRRVCAGQCWRVSGFVSERCCPPMAYHSAHSLLHWHPRCLKCFNRPLNPPKRQKDGVHDDQSVTLSGSGPVKRILRQLIQLAGPNILSRPLYWATTLPSLLVLFFPLKSLGCVARSPVNCFRGNATEKQEAGKFNWEHKYSFKNKPSNHNKYRSVRSSWLQLCAPLLHGPGGLRPSLSPQANPVLSLLSSDRRARPLLLKDYFSFENSF